MQRDEKKYREFLEENKGLFWHFDKSKLHLLSDDVVVEYILNYGNEKSVKALFDIMGLEHVAEVFYRNTAPGRRINYFARTKHFFDLYFKRHAHRNIESGAI